LDRKGEKNGLCGHYGRYHREAGGFQFLEIHTASQTLRSIYENRASGISLSK